MLAKAANCSASSPVSAPETRPTRSLCSAEIPVLTSKGGGEGARRMPTSGAEFRADPLLPSPRPLPPPGEPHSPLPPSRRRCAGLTSDLDHVEPQPHLKPKCSRRDSLHQPLPSWLPPHALGHGTQSPWRWFVVTQLLRRVCVARRSSSGKPRGPPLPAAPRQRLAFALAFGFRLRRCPPDTRA